MHRQPSLFGADVTDPSPADLAGLLAGPGEVRRMGGTARVSVAVDAAWRVHVLVAEFAVRGLAAGWEELAGTGFVVRTAFSSRIMPLALAWSGGAPAVIHLAGPALRLWVAAAGAPAPLDGAAREGFDLRLGSERGDWPAVGAALAAAGLSATLIAEGPAYRITGRRRLRRLAELVGDRPSAAPATAWPMSMSLR